jgi:cytochrome c1
LAVAFAGCTTAAKKEITMKSQMENVCSLPGRHVTKNTDCKHHRKKGGSMKTGVVLLASIFCLVSTTVFAYEGEDLHEPHQHRHMQYTKEKNPIPMNEQSIIKGKELYGKHCLRCHGEGGKAGGNLDLIKAVFIHGDSDGEIFHVITDGVKGTAMRAFKNDLMKDMRWNLVNYIKSLKGQK